MLEMKDIMAYEEYHKRFIEAEVSSVKSQVWCHGGAPISSPLREISTRAVNGLLPSVHL